MTQSTNRSAPNKKPEREPSATSQKSDADPTGQSKDLKANGDKLNVSHLKDEATNAIVEAKDAMVDKLVDVKDSAAAKLSDAKDATVETLSDAKDAALELAQDAGEQVKQLGSATLDFARTNAMPLALIGLGAGWLVSSLLDRSSSSSAAQRAKAKRSRSAARPQNRTSESDDARDLPARISSSAAELASAAKNKGQQLTNKAKRGAASVTAGVKRAGSASLEYADNNPLAVAAVSVAAGVGIGMLLPSTPFENRWFGAGRDRLFGEARETAQGLGHVVRETVQETSQALR